MMHILVFPFNLDSDQEQPFPADQLSREQTPVPSLIYKNHTV